MWLACSASCAANSCACSRADITSGPLPAKEKEIVEIERDKYLFKRIWYSFEQEEN